MSQPAPLDAATATDRVQRYLDLVASGTAAEIGALYAPGATLEDPVGSGRREGRAAIEEFYSAIEGLEATTRLLALRASGNEVAFHFEMVTAMGENSVTIAPIDVMAFDDDGLITSMRAYWSDADMTIA